MFKFIKLAIFTIIFLNILTGIAFACKPCVGDEAAAVAANNLIFWISGVVFATLLAFKAGVGSGLAGLKKRQIIPIVILYPFMVFLVYLIPEELSGFPLIFRLLGTFVAFYAVMSLILIAVGIYTVKKEQIGQDISTRSFLALASPCPLLIASLILVLMFMPGELSDFWSVSLVAMGLAITIIIAYFAGKLKASPLKLGNLMIASGLGLITAVLVIPAYFEMEANIGFGGGWGGTNQIMTGGNVLVLIVFCGLLIGLGMVRESLRGR